MKYRELLRIFRSLGYLPENAKGDHVKFSNGINSFTVPFRGGKDVNRMLSRRLLKEAGYKDWRSV
jgi:predicted RNA binding protein YcfA (HicA-like mRNA interferase family)